MRTQNDPRSRLAAFVRDRIKALGEPSLGEIASRLPDYSYAHLWNIVHGRGPKQPTPELLEALAIALETTYEQVWLAVYGADVPPGLCVVPRVAGA
jgi:hypothetical protein